MRFFLYFSVLSGYTLLVCGGETSSVGLDYSAAISYQRGFFLLLKLDAYTRLEFMMHYGLKRGNRFLLIKDEVTDVLYIGSAI